MDGNFQGNYTFSLAYPFGKSYRPNLFYYC